MARCLHYLRVVMAISDLVAWASSGAMLLTGQPGGPPRPEPSGVSVAARAAADDVAAMTAASGSVSTLMAPRCSGSEPPLLVSAQGSVSVGVSPVLNEEPTVGGAQPSASIGSGPVARTAPCHGRTRGPVTTRRLITALSVDELVARGSSSVLSLGPMSSHRWHHRAVSSPVVRCVTLGLGAAACGRPVGAVGWPTRCVSVAEAGRVVKVEARDRPDGARSESVL